MGKIIAFSNQKGGVGKNYDGNKSCRICGAGRKKAFSLRI